MKTDVKQIRKNDVIVVKNPITHPCNNIVLVPTGTHVVSMRGVTFVELWLGGCDYHQISLAHLKYELKNGNIEIQ